MEGFSRRGVDSVALFEIERVWQVHIIQAIASRFLWREFNVCLAASAVDFKADDCAVANSVRMGDF
jgi:hypothetical protein